MVGILLIIAASRNHTRFYNGNKLSHTSYLFFIAAKVIPQQLSLAFPGRKTIN